MAYIYLTTNLINNRIYVGQRVLPSTKDGFYLGSGKALKNAIKKYGKSNFKKKIIVEGNFNQNLLDDLEKHYIQLYSPPESPLSYNISKGGNKDNKAASLIAAKNRTLPVYEFSSDGKLVNTYNSTHEVCEKYNMSYSNIRGQIEHKRKNEFTGTYFLRTLVFEVKKYKSKKPVFIYKDGTLIAEFMSAIEASKMLNINYQKLTNAIRCKSIINKEYYATYNNEDRKINRDKQEKAIALYNDNECLLFYNQTDATKYLNRLYNLKGLSTSRMALFSKYKFKDYCVRSLWEKETIDSNIDIGNQKFNNRK